MKSIMALLGASVVALSLPAQAADHVDERLREANTGLSASAQVGELVVRREGGLADRIDHMAGFRFEAGRQHKLYTNFEAAYLQRGKLVAVEGGADVIKFSTLHAHAKFGKGFAVLPEFQLVPYGAVGYRHTDLEVEKVDHYELGVGLLMQAIFRPVIISVDLGFSAMLHARSESLGERVSLTEKPVFSSKITADIPVGSQHRILVGLDYHRFSYKMDEARIRFKDPVFFVGYRWAM